MAVLASGRSPMGGARLLTLLPALLLMAGFFWAPLASTALASLRGPAGWSLEAYSRLVDGAFAPILLATLQDSALVTLGCLCLGLPTAYALTRINRRWLPLLLVVVIAPLLVSSLIRSYSWVAILGNQGLVNRALLALGLVDRPVKLVYTRLGMLIAMVQVQLPLFILPAFSVMRRIDRSLLRAARSLGADQIVAFVTVFLPLAWPGIAAAAILVFIGALGFFETPALLGPPGAYFLSQSIEARIDSLADQPGAAAQAIVLLGLVGLLALVAAALLRPAPARPWRAGGRSSQPFRQRWVLRVGELGGWLERATRRLAPWRWALVGPVAAATLVLLALPLLVLLPLAFSAAPYLSFPPPGLSLRWIRRYLEDPDWTAATLFTLQVAAAAALLATAAGLAAVVGAARTGPRLRLAVQLAGVAPLVVSPMVLAVAIYGLAARVGLVGSPFAFAGSYALMGLPYAILVIGAAHRRLDPALPRAAVSLGAGPLAALLTVVMPLLAAAIASAFVFAFLAALNDLAVGLFLSSAAHRTLSVCMWDEVRQEITPRMAAVAVVLLGAGAALYGLGRLLGWRLAAARRRRACASS
jgi:putative spermidine/putrescine transport system permease protein